MRQVGSKSKSPSESESEEMAKTLKRMRIQDRSRPITPESFVHMELVQNTSEDCIMTAPSIISPTKAANLKRRDEDRKHKMQQILQEQLRRYKSDWQSRTELSYSNCDDF